MPTENISLELPISVLERISEIVDESGIFDNHQDVIIHAIIDLLEQYGKGGC